MEFNIKHDFQEGVPGKDPFFPLEVLDYNIYYELISIVKELNEAIKRGGDLQLGQKGRNATLEQRVTDVLKKV